VAAAEPAVSVSPKDGAPTVRLDKPVKVTVKQGTLGSVRVTTSRGETLNGKLSSDGASWKSSGTLLPGTSYTVSASTSATDGTARTTSSTFKTRRASVVSTTFIQPNDGWTVGVGMPIVVIFSRPVTNRAAVEKGLTVTSSKPAAGGWHWFSSRQVQWRPKKYWPANTNVHVTAKLGRVQVAKGVWGEARTRTADYRIGSAMISTVNVRRHTLTVRQNGKVIRVIPVTTGKSGYATRNGTKVIMSRETERRMDAATTGTDASDPEYYDVTVKYAMRLTYSGEFLHAAPWSVGSQGRANVSHGCTGMSTANARWLFARSKVGDVVVYTGSPRPIEWGNGYTAWNMPFSRWSG
jgi:lipoprotein-anchoring transpeptidase ErfK/SrfK